MTAKACAIDVEACSRFNVSAHFSPSSRRIPLYDLIACATAKYRSDVKANLKLTVAIILAGCTASNALAQPVKDGGTEFKANYCIKPTYLAEARRAGVEGYTVVSYFVDTEGLVKEAKILKPSGDSRTHELLDRQALRAVKACRFRQAVGYGMGTIEFAWRLTD